MHHDERAFLALVVDGRAIGIGQADTVEQDSLLLDAVDLEESVVGGAGEFVDEHLAAGVVDRDLVAVDAHITIAVAVDGRITRLRVGDRNPSLEGRGGDVVVGGRVAGGGEGERIAVRPAARGAHHRQHIGGGGCAVSFVRRGFGGNQGGSASQQGDGSVRTDGGHLRLRGFIGDADVERVGQRGETVLCAEGGFKGIGAPCEGGVF